MRFATAFIAIAFAFAAASAPAQDCPPERTPSLTPHIESPSSMATVDGRKNPYADFKGLMLEENLVREVYPLLLYVFFDAGSAQIPSRYRRLTTPEATHTFQEQAIPGGTLRKYHHLLDIVGSRMRRYPTTRIQIVGCNSEQPALGETIDVSKQRGEVLYAYLTAIWGIDPARIEMLPPRGFPESRSNPRDSAFNVENRRAEIRSSDWEILKPLDRTELRGHPLPSRLEFRMVNGRRDAARRWIDVRRGGALWATFLPDVPVHTWCGDYVRQQSYRWAADVDEDSLPNDETPFSFQLVVADSSGAECRSAEAIMPVLLMSQERRAREGLAGRPQVQRFALIEFRFDSPEPGPVNDRIIREYLAPAVRQGARVAVRGFSHEQDPCRSWHMSHSRTRRVIDEIRKLTPTTRAAEYAPASDEEPPFSIDLPEGRFYSRTVQIVVENPVSIATE